MRTSRVSVVIGLGFGDEGKGLVVDHLAADSNGNSLVVRFSGGPQAGHTVHRDGVSHVFSNFGAGSLVGAHTYWSKFCPFDPVGFVKEFKALTDKGYNPSFNIDYQCPIITPLDKIHNQLTDFRNGTCGTGVGTTKLREESFISLTVADLLFKEVFRLKMERLIDYYLAKNVVKDWEKWMDEFYEACEFVRDLGIGFYDWPDFWRVAKLQTSNVIFEGSQGLIIDQNIGFFPHVSRGNVDTTNVGELIGPNEPVDMYYVSRIYQTRHGNGPMTNQFLPEPKVEYPEETNVLNQFQGQFRKSVLDLDLLSYALIRENSSRKIFTGSRTLVLTCFNHIPNGPYSFTKNSKLFEFKTKEEFVSELTTKLPTFFNSVLISLSDKAYGLTKVV